MTNNVGRPHVVCVRYRTSDLEVIEDAMRIMGSATISAFTREASIKLARAIIEASLDSGLARSSWDACWIEGSLERKPTSHGPEGS